MSLRDLVSQLELYMAEELDRESLRHWFTGHIAARTPRPDLDEGDGEALVASWSPVQDEETLFWQLVWLFEGDHATDEEHRDLARRVLGCYQDTGSADFTSNVLPLLSGGTRLCSIVEKHRRGIVSRAGLSSVIRKAFWADGELFAWLAAASLSNLEEACRYLAQHEYVALRFLLDRPPA